MKNRNERKFTGLYSRLLSGFIVILLFGVALAAGVTYHVVHSFILKKNEAELKEKAEFIAASELHALDWQLLRKYQTLIDAEVIYVRTDYTAVRLQAKHKYMDKEQENDVFYTGIVSQMDKKIISDIFQGKHVSGVENVDFLTDKIVYAGVPYKNGQDDTSNALLLVRLVKDVDAMWVQTFFSACLVLVCTILLASGVCALFTRTITHPVRAMSDAAGSMAAGEYSIRVPIARNDEVGQLAGTINVLAERLNEVITSLKDEKSKIEQILFNITEGIIAFDNEGKVIHNNSAALEILEICSWNMCADENECKYRDEVVRLRELCMQSRKPESVTWKTRSGRLVTATASPARSTDGEMTGVVCLLRDVSEEQRLEQLRREYIANVSHELRTPLTGIRGMVEPLLDGVLETEKEKNDCYQVIYKETLRLEKLIAEMLDLSRLQDGRIRVEIERMELTNVIRRAVLSMKKLSDAASVSVEFDCDKEVFCMGNEDRIIQTLVILIDNAVSFTPAGGKITITVTDAEYVYVSVKDTGAGIEPQHLPYIWERFYKADKSRMHTTGTGLGLAIAKRVVELMGGTISVRSEPGQGAEFTFTLKKQA